MKYFLILLISLSFKAFSNSKSTEFLFYLKPIENGCEWKLMKLPKKEHKVLHNHKGECPQEIKWNSEKKWALFFANKRLNTFIWDEKIKARKMAKFKSKNKNITQIKYWLSEDSGKIRHLYKEDNQFVIVERSKKKWNQLGKNENQDSLKEFMKEDPSYKSLNYKTAPCTKKCLDKFLEDKDLLKEKLTTTFESLDKVSMYQINDFRFLYTSDQRNVNLLCDPTCAIQTKIKDALPKNKKVYIRPPYIFITNKYNNRGVISFFDHSSKADLNLPGVTNASWFPYVELWDLIP